MMNRRRAERKRDRKIIMKRRKEFIQMVGVISKDSVTFMEQEFQALIHKVQREEEKKIRLIVDNTSLKGPARAGLSLIED